MNKLKEGDILIALKDDIIHQNYIAQYYFYKNVKYKISHVLPLFPEKSWAVRRCDNDRYYALSEDYILKNFNCIRIHRKEKLERLKNE